MALFKDLKELRDELEYWENINPTNWFSKWIVGNKVNKLKNKIQNILTELENRKK